MNLPSRNKKLLREEHKHKVTKVQSLPEELTLATTIRCNKIPPCSMCDRNLRTPADEYDCPSPILENLKAFIPYLDIVYLHCSGEPLVYKKFDELLNLVKPPTKIRFNTNGVLLTKKKIEMIVDSGTVDVINFSIDAATKETYEKLRGHGFDPVANNIKNLTEYKKKVGAGNPFIVINMCVMKENIAELPAFVHLGKEVGAGAIDVFHLNKGRDWRIERRNNFIFDYKDQEQMDPDLHDEAIIKAYETCLELEIDMNFAGTVFFSDKDKKKEAIGKRIRETEKWDTCIAPWSRVAVGVDGNVRICCYHKELDEGIGNLNATSFQEIWKGEKAIEVRKEFLQRGHSIFCEKENICVFMGRK